jgi:CheY-like chemotaxis protein
MIRVDSILLIDDDESALFIGKKIIEHMNVARETYSCTDGHAALELIKHRYYSAKSLPSLILLDLNMPEMNGFELLKKLKESDLWAVKNIPVVVLTSSEYVEDIINVSSIGCFNLIHKPLTEEKLISTINKILPMG